MQPTCKDCGAELHRHPYAKHADDRPVLVCPTHGIRDSLTTVPAEHSTGGTT